MSCLIDDCVCEKDTCFFHTVSKVDCIKHACTQFDTSKNGCTMPSEDLMQSCPVQNGAYKEYIKEVRKHCPTQVENEKKQH